MKMKSEFERKNDEKVFGKRDIDSLRNNVMSMMMQLSMLWVHNKSQMWTIFSFSNSTVSLKLQQTVFGPIIGINVPVVI